MAMRVQEIHPAVAHYPLALFPMAAVLDGLGWVSRSRRLMWAGGLLLPIATLGAAVTGIAGFLAQGSVRLPDAKAERLLVTHRTLNVSLLLAGTVLTALRLRRREPTAAQVLLGLIGAAAMTYSGYLGGKMVYGHGVGVEPAGGVAIDRAPEVAGDLGAVARVAARNTGDALRETAEDTRKGRLVPALEG